MAKLKKIRSGKFTQISNVVFDDPRLSYKEIGLFCNMMKFPDNWEFSVRYLADLHQDKKAAVSTGIEKLIEYGYITRTGSQQRNEKGLFGTYDYIIYEDPNDNPDYVPFPVKSEEMTVSDNRSTDNQTPISAVSDFRSTDDQPPNATVSDFRSTDDPLTDYRLTDNPPTNNTFYNNTVSNNTFLRNTEEDDDIARVDREDFKRKMMNGYMNTVFSIHDEGEKKKVLQAFNSILNAVQDIEDPSAIRAINHCDSEEADSLFKWVYANLFRKTLGEVPIQVTDIHAYLIKVISNRMKSSYGPDPFDSWGICAA